MHACDACSMACNQPTTSASLCRSALAPWCRSHPCTAWIPFSAAAVAEAASRWLLLQSNSAHVSCPNWEALNPWQPPLPVRRSLWKHTHPSPALPAGRQRGRLVCSAILRVAQFHVAASGAPHRQSGPASCHLCPLCRLLRQGARGFGPGEGLLWLHAAVLAPPCLCSLACAPTCPSWQGLCSGCVEVYTFGFILSECRFSVRGPCPQVVLDFAVNDGHVSPNGRDKLGYSFDGGARRGFEQLLRKSLKLPGQPAVALLQFFSWNATRDKIEVGCADGGWAGRGRCRKVGRCAGGEACRHLTHLEQALGPTARPRAAASSRLLPAC